MTRIDLSFSRGNLLYAGCRIKKDEKGYLTLDMPLSTAVGLLQRNVEAALSLVPLGEREAICLTGYADGWAFMVAQQVIIRKGYTKVYYLEGNKHEEKEERVLIYSA